jgi:hypothetical protein
VETDGRAFIVEADIKDLTSHNVDATMRTSLTVLRHLVRTHASQAPSFSAHSRVLR